MSRKGWHSRGYLPHCDCRDLVQHIVFRLHDSLPEHVMRELKDVPLEEHASFTDAVLDRCLGAAYLHDAAAAQVVADAIVFFDGARYRLHAWCVMPNHVHVVAGPLGASELGAIVRSWKTFAANRINAMLGRRGPVWAKDYFDRFMRSDEQFYTTIRYVENNPVSANLCARPEDWPYSSAFGRVGARASRRAHGPRASKRAQR